MAELIAVKKEDHHQSNYKRTVFGFWLYLMTDCILFATLFAAYVVLRDNTFGGPNAKELFSLPYVLIETLILLVSSFTCGLAMLTANQQRKTLALALFGVTFALGIAFLVLEIHEFIQLVQEGHSWSRSAFLSSYFTLVGTHGFHILCGLLWIAVLFGATLARGLTPDNLKKWTCLSLFWHLLDVVWIFIFTVVYLIGVSI